MMNKDVTNIQEFVANAVIDHLSKTNDLIEFVKDRFSLRDFFECANSGNTKFECYGWEAKKDRDCDINLCRRCQKKFCSRCTQNCLLLNVRRQEAICINCMDIQNIQHRDVCFICESGENVKLLRLDDEYDDDFCVYCTKCKCLIKKG